MELTLSAQARKEKGKISGLHLTPQKRACVRVASLARSSYSESSLVVFPSYRRKDELGGKRGRSEINRREEEARRVSWEDKQGKASKRARVPLSFSPLGISSGLLSPCSIPL